MAMACQSGVSSLSSSSYTALSFSAAWSPCSSSAMASLLLPRSFQGLRSSGSRARSLRITRRRRPSSFSFTSFSSSRPLLVTAGELPLVGNEAPDFEAEAVFDQEFVKAAFGTEVIHKLGQAFWEMEGQSTLQQPRSNVRIFASLDSDDGKADGARKALEEAFQGKSIAKKWEEEIRKRKLSGGDGGGSKSGGGGGWGGGGGGDDEEMSGDYRAEPWDWEEIGQTFMATFVLLVLYLSITRGPKQVFKKFKLLFRYIRQGFRLRKIPDEYLRGSDDDSDDEDYDGDSDDDVAQEGHRTREELSTSNAREVDVQDNSPNYETEDEDDGIPTPPRQQVKREDLLSKRQAEHKEKLFKMLSPKELLQQQQEEERK